MIKTIIFDLAEVYLKGYYLVEEKLEPILNLKSKEIHKKLREKKLEKTFDLLMKGKVTEDNFWKKVVEFNNWKVPLEVLKKAVRDNFKEIEGTREIIEKLKNRGYKLGLLSNHSREWIEYCEKKFDYRKLFHSVLYSFEIEVCKPNKRAYKHILKKLNTEPEECLFIDDSKKNISVANKLGISTILFKSSEQLIKALKGFSIQLD